MPIRQTQAKQKLILTLEQVDELVRENRYKVDEKTKFLSRCIDGRYPTQSDLPALALTGADAGELAVILATAHEYGFEVDKEKVYKTLIEVVGGEKNLRFHTDTHAANGTPLAGCGHVKKMSEHPLPYKLETEDVDFIKKKAERAIKKNAIEEVLEGDHEEGAVLLVSNEGWGIYPRFQISLSGQSKEVQVFMFHQSLVDARHRALAAALIKNKAVKLFEGLDEEYLYEVLSTQTEDHLLETARQLAKGLPIYSVEFKPDGAYTLDARGAVE